MHGQFTCVGQAGEGREVSRVGADPHVVAALRGSLRISDGCEPFRPFKETQRHIHRVRANEVECRVNVFRRQLRYAACKSGTVRHGLRAQPPHEVMVVCVLAVPITRAPCATAIWTPSEPTPPAAACARTVSPARMPTLLIV